MDNKLDNELTKKQRIIESIKELWLVKLINRIRRRDYNAGKDNNNN